MTTPRLAWEYLVLVLSTDLGRRECELNEAGRLGWELVAFDPDCVAYFRRPR